MERLHKMVNGQKVFLTEEEEKEMRAEWASNEMKAAERKMIQEAEIKKKYELKQKLCSLMGITMEECELMMR